MAELQALAARLASIPSHEEPDPAGDAIETWLRTETNAKVRRDEVGNVFASRGSGRTLALVGHHDVVPPAASQVAAGEYVVESRAGRLYGRGTADMKGALAAMLLAFRDADPEGELVFASFVGEEAGGIGARAAIEDGFVPDYAVVGEGSTGYSAPGVLDVAVAHKGRRGSTIRAAGTAAHASEPDAGENAVYRATAAIDAIRALPRPETTVAGRSMEGSVAVTEIEGGTAKNVVPEECVVTVDERTVPGGRLDLDRVEDHPGVTWTVDQDLPPMGCADDSFVETVLAAANAAQAANGKRVVKPHATDAGWLAEAGTTALVCGPAETGEAHTAQESVSLAALSAVRRCYERVASTWPGGKP